MGYKGKCENLHGHNWKIAASVKGERLDRIGILVDFHEIKRILKGIIGELDHKNLNDIPPFNEINPTSENIAKYIYEKFTDALGENNEAVKLESITVWESETSKCTYFK
ncbi:MAG: 6-carboxytetrahydropterin synthase [Spirochaetes bacterium]|jgi:6-pyruvoyltetrahydropterin/6-carboxytetrahydropterin synthase|nr:6-carboxytetrahydropterin synthase [Spirochaetota bacterium]